MASGEQRTAGLLRGSIMPIMALLLFVAAMWAIHKELALFRIHDVTAALRGLPLLQMGLAVLVAIAGYAVLAFYDVLALSYLAKPLALGRALLAGFVGYAFSHTIGLSVVTGGAVRLRLYTSWGLGATEIAGLIAFNAVTTWVGVAAILVVGGLAVPDEVGHVLGLGPGMVQVLAVVTALALAGYLLLGAVVRRPVNLRGWSFIAPSPAITLQQLVLATVDWVLAAATLWVLLPDLPIGFLAFTALFTLANLAGVISHVPAGLGVFEAVLLLALPDAHTPGVAAGIIVYRLIYYVLPMLVAALLFATHQARGAGEAVRTRLVAARGVAALVLPNLLAALVSVGGLVLLVSVATPAMHDRIAWIGPLAPLALVELSHFLASLVGLALLLLGLGLRRRLDGAYLASLVALAAGALFSMVKGVDWEEALYLLVVFALLLPCRGAFYRKSRLLAQRLTPSWLLAMFAVVLGTVWLVFFSYRHVAYANELWWQFVLEHDAPRSLRAAAGVVIAAVILGGLQLLRFAPSPARASEAEIRDARAAIEGAELVNSHAFLALLGDKRFLFSPSGRSFIMYGVQGRSWVAMGEPVGLASERLELVWRFRELCDAWGGRPVFYEIGPGLMPDLVELGLTFFKLGEQAYVPLKGFSLEGPARANLRQSWRRAGRDGATFAILPAAEVAEVMGELREVSDLWLRSKQAKEKGFSLGRFDPAYISQCDLAVVRKGDRIVAFANLWRTPDKRELSIDLMRYRDGELRDVMDYLFTSLILWGAEQGYQRFDLGMAPLSGLPSRALSPLWIRAASLIFQYGEQFYNFEGLRRYKEKFRPVWEPRYLAASGGLSLPVVLSDVTALVSGGVLSTVRA